jgi:hypothetical protein
MHLVVDVGEVTGGGSLTNATELIINGTVTEADPSLVGTEVGHGNAAQMSANSRAAENWRVSGIWNRGLALLIKKGGGGEGVGEVDFGLGKATHKDHLSVPGSLEDLSWGKLRDIELLVGITNVTSTSDHLVVNDSDNGLDTEEVRADNESLDHVGLGTLNLVVSVLFIPESVLVEPVVVLGLGIKRIAEVRGAGGGNPEHIAVGSEKVVSQFLVLTLVVLLHNTEVTGSGGYNWWLDGRFSKLGWQY